MTRKGFEKARTGCITCKTRKIKCDETKPDCMRCRKSRLACAGYKEPPPGSYSWLRLLRPRPSTIPGCEGLRHHNNGMEMRSLEYFRCVVAPALSGPLYTHFWSKPVLQLSLQDASARHAVLAISLLYEKSERAYINPGYDPARQEYAALSYYNQALQQVATSPDVDVNLVLFLTILFTCIECLRGNQVGASDHCRHCIQMLLSCRNPPPEISPMLRHLSIFPFCFGATLLDFPTLPSCQRSPGGPFRDIFEATECLDNLMALSTRLVRRIDPYRFGLPGGPAADRHPPRRVVSAWHGLRRDLDAWFSGLMHLRGREQREEASSGGGGGGERLAMYRTIEMRWRVCRIWLETAFQSRDDDEDDDDDSAFDAHLASFQRIVELGREELAYKELTGTLNNNSNNKGGGGVFTFEMGLSPLLDVVVAKCRDRPLRLEAMDLSEKLGSPRNTVWTAVRQAIKRRVVEREHDIQLPPEHQETLQECLDLNHSTAVIIDDESWNI